MEECRGKYKHYTALVDEDLKRLKGFAKSM